MSFDSELLDALAMTFVDAAIRELEMQAQLARLRPAPPCTGSVNFAQRRVLSTHRCNTVFRVAEHHQGSGCEHNIAAGCGVRITEDDFTWSSVSKLKPKEEYQMNLDDFRNSMYLTQRDIENLSAKERLVTVDHVDVERVGEEKVLKPVTYFVTLVKGLVTNITNGEVLSDIVGSIKLVDWHGADVEIYVDPSVGYGGKRTGGIRLRPIPTHKSQTVEEEYDEVMTFGDKEVA